MLPPNGPSGVCPPLLLLLWLQLAVILVVTLQGLFLVAWRSRSISSFIIGDFRGREKEILSTGIYYLIQMHVVFFVMAGFT